MAASTGPVVRHRTGEPTPLDGAWALVRAALEPCRRRPTVANEAALLAALRAYRRAVVADITGMDAPERAVLGPASPAMPEAPAVEPEEWPF